MKGNKGRHNRSRSRDLQQAAGSGDRLSKLPNDLLLNILERVSTTDAVRTCILSKRMQKLPTMFSQIKIDVCTILHDCPLSTVRDMVRMNGDVANATEMILSTRSPQITVRRLKLRFFLRRYDCLSIGKSVARAMATQKLDAIEFKILTEKDSDEFTKAEQINYAKQFNTFLRDCPDAFAGLTRLHRQNPRFGESDIPNILSTCKRLESLSLQECDAGVDSVLQVEHARLVELEIILGDYKKVELIYLPQLQRMTCDQWNCEENPLFFGFAPQLFRLSLISRGLTHNPIELSQLLATVSFISDLHLSFESEKIWVVPECPELLVPVLGKLRFVNLDKIPEGCDIAWTMFILEAAPFLEELSITVWDHWCQEVPEHNDSQETYLNWKSASSFSHKNLAKLIIYGFQSDDNFIGYVRRVMEVAVNVEERSLHDRKACKSCVAEFGPETMACPSRYPRTDEERDSVREKITGPLGMASPVVIHFRS